MDDNPITPKEKLEIIDEISNISMHQRALGHEEDPETAQREKESIFTSNSSERSGIMSSKAQSKAKAIRRVPVKKKTAIAASKSKNQSKLKLKDEEEDSISDGSSSDGKFLEEFESDGSGFSSSTDSDDLSQEFSDEDRLMEYYEKKLHEHAIVGNLGYNSDDNDDSESSQELKKLVEDTFKPKPSTNRNQTIISTSLAKKASAKVNMGGQAKMTKSSGKSKSVKGSPTTHPLNAGVKLDMKFVISGLKSEKGPMKGDGAIPRNIPAPKLPKSDGRRPTKRASRPLYSVQDPGKHATNLPRNLQQPLDLKPGSREARAHVVNRTISTPLNLGRSPETNLCKEGSNPGSHQKVLDYLARVKQVKNSISEINHKINTATDDAADMVLQSARVAILEQCDRNKKLTSRVQEKEGAPTSTSSTTASGRGPGFDEKQRMKDEAVDRILNATLGVS